jgi:AAA15 family ATPase/GTPase
MPTKNEIKRLFANKDFKTEYKGLFNEYFDFLSFHSNLGYAICPYIKNPIYWGKQFTEFSKKFTNNLKKLVKQYSEKDPTLKGARLNLSFYNLPLYPGIIYLKEKSVEDGINIVKIDHYNKLEFFDVSEEDLIGLEDFIKKNIVKNLKRLSQREVVYQKDDSLITMPVCSYGDGFITLLNTIRYLLKAKNGILLIEEPENHLHPRYIDIFIENLYLYCKELNVQVFMATHSLDLIRSALKFPETSAEKDLLLISKMTSDGDVVEKFDFNTEDALKVIDELYLDLRGN